MRSTSYYSLHHFTPCHTLSPLSEARKNKCTTKAMSNWSRTKKHKAMITRCVFEPLALAFQEHRWISSITSCRGTTVTVWDLRLRGGFGMFRCIFCLGKMGSKPACGLNSEPCPRRDVAGGGELAQLLRRLPGGAAGVPMDRRKHRFAAHGALLRRLSTCSRALLSPTHLRHPETLKCHETTLPVQNSLDSSFNPERSTCLTTASAKHRRSRSSRLLLEQLGVFFDRCHHLQRAENHLHV